MISKQKLKTTVKGKLPFNMTEIRGLSHWKQRASQMCKCLVQNTYFAAPIEVKILKRGITHARAIEKAQEHQSTNHVSTKKWIAYVRKLLSYFDYTSKEGNVLEENGNYDGENRKSIMKSLYINKKKIRKSVLVKFEFTVYNLLCLNRYSM